MADEPGHIIGADGGQVVRSPEQVALYLPIAGPTARMLAYAIDYVVIGAALVGALLLLLLTTKLVGTLLPYIRELLRGEEPAGSFIVLLVVVVLLLQLVIEASYFVLFEMATGGRSLGKWCIGLRVVRDGGFPLTLRDSLVRNLLRMVDVLPGYYVVGLVSMIVSREGKRLGDLAAGTIVVRLDRPPAAAPLGEDAAAEQSPFRFDRGQIARLGPDELALVRETLRRWDTLPPGARERSVAALRERIGYGPVPSEEGEPFLRALIAATRVR